MRTVISEDKAVLFHGDSKEIPLPPGCVDSIVCDPPAGIGFMGKGWDGDKGGRLQWIAWLTETMAASYAALKPGGHALVWAIPRTSHWTMTALEEMGFEIRDVVTHLFGSGFPKSANVSKLIDSTLGATREKIMVPTKSHNKMGQEGDVALGATGFRDISDPVTPEAAQWDGFGTALKPGAEFWILCRKPLGEKTIAKNVLKHGTGALNIDACRIGTDDSWAPSTRDANESIGTFKTAERTTEQHEGGRWPMNVTLDEEAAALLDEQCPKSKPKKGRTGKRGGNGFGLYDDEKSAGTDGTWPADPGGGVSRFFYVAKPSKAEKSAGLDHLEMKSPAEVTGSDQFATQKRLDCPRTGAGRSGAGARNSHPTVKSVALMTWLIKLITPPGGIVLDPFAGSGTTGVAAILEGFRFIGCELTEEYLPIVEGRLRHAIQTQKDGE